MDFDQLVSRINALYHKSQTEGLTDPEREEQIQLRRQYIDTLKGNLKSQLDQIKIQDPDHVCADHNCDCGKY
jgi:uncharacterized protein YnzC (UPF0291/DUF896 family)